MLKSFLAVLIPMTLIVACGPIDGGKGGCPDGYVACGTKCMAEGNSCCPDDDFSCARGYACSPDNMCFASSGVQGDCPVGYEVCGTRCMAGGNDCCPDDTKSCKPGYSCTPANKCIANGGPTTGTKPGGSSGSTGSSGMGECGTCSGQLECSGWMTGDKCNWQSCACYYIQNGSDTMKEFYHSSDGQCFQCSQTGTTCTSAAQALINHCYSF